MMNQDTPGAAQAEPVEFPVNPEGSSAADTESASPAGQDHESGSGSGSALKEDQAAQLEAVEAHCGQLERKVAELSELLLRRTAEFDNFRKRTDREKLELCEYASEQALKAMLPVLDDFERALKVETPDAEYAKGIGLIHSRMYEALRKLGLEPVESLGKPFDPNFHHAIELVPTQEAEDQTVLDELQRGYTLKGRLLRAAMVRVASGS